MMRLSRFLPSLESFCILSFLYLALTFIKNKYLIQPSVGLIVDTDFFGDVNDAGALLLACTHPDAQLLAVNLNYPSSFSASAISNILGYYDKHTIPLGVRRPFNNNTYIDLGSFDKGEFATKVAHHWRAYNSDPREVYAHGATWDPVDLYRRVLSRATTGGVTIASVGFLENLSDLLDSPADKHSELTGYDLVKQKVKELVILGGQYPFGQGFPFVYNATTAMNVVDKWPGKMVLSGYELGRNVLTGARFVNEAHLDDPVRSAYEWQNGFNRSRSSWDPLAVLYAIEGPGKTFRLAGDGGHNVVTENGKNGWVQGRGEFAQAYVKLVSNETAAARLEDLFIQGAANSVKTQLATDLIELRHSLLSLLSCP